MKTLLKLLALLTLIALVYPGCEPTEEVPATEITGLALKLTTAGGLHGSGVGNYTMTVNGKVTFQWGSESCGFTLSDSEYAELVKLANAVDWDAMQSKYVNPQNPNGCCDQIGYTLASTLVRKDGNITQSSSFWYDETTNQLPTAFAKLTSTFHDLGASYRQAGKCKPSNTVLLTPDKKQYNVGDEIAPVWENLTSEAIYLPGCTTWGFERKKGDSWEYLGPMVACFWEGVARKIAPNDTLVAETTSVVSQSGTYRLRGEYSTGCKDGLPLSQAECTGGPTTVYSATFTVNAN